MGPEKIWLRFWDIFPENVQNDLKTLGNLFLGRDLNFLKNVKIESGKKLFTLLEKSTNPVKKHEILVKNH